MPNTYLAKINWLSEKEGGRKSIPTGDKYAPIIVMKDKCLNLNEPNWSLFVNNLEKINTLETIAEVKYLSELAPNNLGIGKEFKLHEGPKKVANGIIIKSL